MTLPISRTLGAALFCGVVSLLVLLSGSNYAHALQAPIVSDTPVVSGNCTDRTVTVTGNTSGVVWGSGPYASISDIGAAAVHAGLIKVGDRVSIKLTAKGTQITRGSTANGVTSLGYPGEMCVVELSRAQTSAVLPDRTLCPMSARMCPSGLYVSASGPNCEFVCPDGTQPAPPAFWETPPVDSSSITQTLRTGSRGPQVSTLQGILVRLGYLDAENISGFFGNLTYAALQKFQCAESIICTGTPDTTGYGATGPLTRAALNQHLTSSGGGTVSCPAPGVLQNGVCVNNGDAAPTCPSGSRLTTIGVRQVCVNIGPTPVPTTTTPMGSLQEVINALIAQIQDLQRQLSAIQGGTPTTPTTGGGILASCPTGTSETTINGVRWCRTTTGTCPSGFVLQFVSGTAVCNVSSVVTPPASGGGTTGGTATGGTAISSFAITPPLVTYGGTVSFSWGSSNTVSSDGVRIICMKPGATGTSTKMGEAGAWLPPNGARITDAWPMVGTHTCTAQVMRGGVPVSGSARTATYVVQGSGTGGTDTGTGTGGTGTGGGTTGGGTSGGGPSATGLSCYQDNLYSNGTLSMTCPKAPNGGIACQIGVSSEKTGCAGDGFTWINGSKVRWSGNTSGACFADSACERNYVCGSTSKRCEPKKEFSNDPGVTMPAGYEGGQYKRTWLGTAWSDWTLVTCLGGYYEQGGRCLSSQRACSMPNAPGVQNYNTSTRTWGTCQYTYFPGTDRVKCNDDYIWGNETTKCIKAVRECSISYNPYPTTYPRGTSVGTGEQRWDATMNGTGGWDQCNLTCKTGYTKEWLQADTLGLDYFTIAPGVTQTALDYCAPSHDTLVTGELSIPAVSTTDYRVSWSTESGGLNKTTTCKIRSGASRCDLTTTWSSRNATAGSLTKDGASVDNGTSGSYRFTIRAENTDVLELTLQPGNVKRTNTIVAICEEGASWNGSICTTSTSGGSGGSGGGGSGSGSGGTPSIEVGLTNVDGTTSGKQWCEVRSGASSCQITVSWWGAQNITSAALYPGGMGPHVPLKTGLSGSHAFTLRPEAGDTTYVLETTPSISGAGSREGTLYAKCASGTTWDGSKCASGSGSGGSGTGSSAPTASLNITPSGTVTYPRIIEYRLTSTGAMSCLVRDDRITYVSPSENVTNKTLTSLTTPGTLNFTTQCWSGRDGTGVASSEVRRSITVVCPSGQSWNGLACI